VGALSAKHGETLVRLARYSLESSLKPNQEEAGGAGGCEAKGAGSRCANGGSWAGNGICCGRYGCKDKFFLVDEMQEKMLTKKSGAYVTVRAHPSLERMAERGTHGQERTLAESVAGAAINIAEELSSNGGLEPKKAVFEVTVLSAPKRLRAKGQSDYQKLIRAGKGGVLVKYGKASALVLPQHSAELNYSAQEILSFACEKAGIPREMWCSPTLELYSLEAQVFSEKEPDGRVFEKKVMA
jgi:uncharacterized protein (TIGR00296 family)